MSNSIVKRGEVITVISLSSLPGRTNLSAGDSTAESVMSLRWRCSRADGIDRSFGSFSLCSRSRFCECSAALAFAVYFYNTTAAFEMAHRDSQQRERERERNSLQLSNIPTLTFYDSILVLLFAITSQFDFTVKKKKRFYCARERSVHSGEESPSEFARARALANGH